MARTLGQVRRAPLVLWLAVASIAVGDVAWIACLRSRAAMSPCESEMRHGSMQQAIATCSESYQRTGNEQDLDWAAAAALQIRELDQAEQLASQLLHGRFFGDAHQILGSVSVYRDRTADAWTHARIAFATHQLAGDDKRVARDAMLLSNIALKQGDYTAAIAAADEATRLARALGDGPAVVRAAVARADALRRVGDVDGATATLIGADDEPADACGKAWLVLKLALALQVSERLERASREFARARQLNRRCGTPLITDAIDSNEAWLLRDADPAAAQARVEALIQVAPDEPELFLLRGYLAANRGALGDARRDLDHAESLEATDADWPWELARARAELAELHGGVFGPLLAEFYYRRAIAMITALRAAARARSAYLVASHRGPYDGLIALLARHGRWRAALDVMLDLDASDMLRATANEIVDRDRAEPGAPAAAAAAAPKRSTVEAVLAAWQSRDLVIVIAPSRRRIAPGGERGYRLRIAGGAITGEDIGAASEAQRLADRVFREPGDRAAAGALGAMMIPPGAEHDTLQVLAIGALGRAPLAALRDGDGALIIGRRPLARVLGLAATGPESRGGGPALVIADPSGELPGAASEGAVVAEALGPSARIAGAATRITADRALLWTASGAEVLHVAGHVAVLGRWRALRLADGDVEPAEMLHHALAPRIAVLAGCGSAAAMDEEGWGSIASALLASGTAVVIATDRTVYDTAALSLMRAFYTQADWRSDPERALARVQQSFDARVAGAEDDPAQPQSWAAFSVLRRPPVVAP
jgi:tetratricopeptide (TPR) repeat protein